MRQRVDSVIKEIQCELKLAKEVVQTNSSVAVRNTDVFDVGPSEIPTNSLSNNEDSVHNLFEIVNTKLYQSVKPLLEESIIQEETESKKVDMDNLHMKDIGNKVEEDIKKIKEDELSLKKDTTEKSITFARKKYDQVLDKYNSIREEYEINKNRVRRHIPLNKFKSSILYYSLLIFIGVCEVPLNKVIFQRFGESDNVTFIMAGTLAIAVPVLAHFIGLFWRQRSEMREYFWKAIIFTLAFLTTNFGLGLFRANVLNEIVANTGKQVTAQDLYLNIGIFVGITTILFIIGVIAAYLRHDPSYSLEHSYNEMLKAKAEYEVERDNYREEEKKLEDNTLAYLQGAHDRYKQSLKDVLDIPKKALDSYDIAKSNTKLVSETAIGLENQIQAEYNYIASALGLGTKPLTKNFQTIKF